MKLIAARSPFQIIINVANQTSSRVELFIWDRGLGSTNPLAIPTYVLSEKIASVTQLETNYNISPYLLEYLNPIIPVAVATPTVAEDNNAWAICQVLTYATVAGVESLITTTTYAVINAYTLVNDGYNFDYTQASYYCLLADTSIKVQYHSIIPYYNLVLERHPTDAYTMKYYNSAFVLISTVSILPAGAFDLVNIKIPLVEPTLATYFVEIQKAGSTIYSFYIEKINECKYTPITCAFINKKGGWNFLMFFKASTDNIATKGTEFSLMQKNIAYDYRIGQKKTQNKNGMQTVKCNTGWVDENYIVLINELMLSEKIVLLEKTGSDFQPVTLKTEQMPKKKWLKDKNINYELEFEYSNNLLNDVL